MGMPAQILWYKINYIISTIRLAPWYISRVSTEEDEPQVITISASHRSACTYLIEHKQHQVGTH